MDHAAINSTYKYLPMDLEATREALAKAKPLLKSGGKLGAWRKDNDMIAWLESL
jgi:hypothetical protein